MIARSLLSTDVDEDQLKANRMLSKRLKYYPLILVICYLPYTIKQVVETTNISQGDYQFRFTLIAGTVRCLHGLLNSIVYGFTHKVKNKIVQIVRSLGGCKDVDRISQDFISEEAVQ